MYIDAHTHVQFAAYDEDREAVLSRAREAGVVMVNVGTQKDTSRAAVDLAREHEGLCAAAGLHPIHTAKSFHDVKELGAEPGLKEFTSRGEMFDYDFYKELASDDKVVAIGECGLDYYRLEEGTKKTQAQAFAQQIKLAQEIQKPLMIHCRSAFPDLITILTEYKALLNDPPGIIHFFSGTPDEAGRLLDLGFYFTFGGVITFARDYDSAIGIIPVDKILSETDAPYVTPMPYRGKRNEPAYVVHVVKKLAELKGLREEEMKEQIVLNARAVFGSLFR